jgi:hypothetical protein
LIKTILKKETKKQKIKEKKTNHVEEHCNNPQCFLRKATVVILNQLNIKKIKSTKIILEKIIKKKIMWGNIIAIHNVLKKKTTKLNSQPT